MSENDIDHEYTPDIVCPHCGHAHEDSWEIAINDEDGEMECYECDKPFRWSQHTTVRYTTKVDPPSPLDEATARQAEGQGA